MGRKGGVAGLLGKAAGKAGDKASRRRKKMGPGSFLRGKPGADFLAQFAQNRAQQQEQARASVQDRLRSAGHGGGLFSRLFDQRR